MTMKGFCWMRMVLPIGSSSPNRFSATVLPMIATRVAERTSESPKPAPLTMFQARASRYSGVVPMTCELQFCEP